MASSWKDGNGLHLAAVVVNICVRLTSKIYLLINGVCASLLSHA